MKHFPRLTIWVLSLALLASGCATVETETGEEEIEFHPIEYLSEVTKQPEDPRFAHKRDFEQDWEHEINDPGFWDSDERFFSPLNQ